MSVVMPLPTCSLVSDNWFSVHVGSFSLHSLLTHGLAQHYTNKVDFVAQIHSRHNEEYVLKLKHYCSVTNIAKTNG